MDILLEPIVRGFLSVSVTEERKSLSLLRQDCLSLDQEACNGGCVWATAGEAAEGEGSRCLIHTPSRDAATDPIRIFTARISDELLRYSASMREILEDSVQAIRTPRGAVRVGDELFLATKPKESANAIMERLGFTGQAAITFPEEMMRFEGAEEEGPGPAGPEAGPEEDTSAPVELPASWKEKGLQVANPPPELEDAKRLAFAEGTGRPLATWEEYLKNRRTKLGIAEPDRPLQWSIQDFYVIASLTSSNVLFVNPGPKIKYWIQPPGAAGAKPEQSMYMIFWGTRELLVTRAKVYRFLTKDLPVDLLAAMDGASPIPEEEAKGSTGPIMAVEDAPPALVEEEEEAAPALVEEAPPPPVVAAVENQVAAPPAVVTPPPPVVEAPPPPPVVAAAPPEPSIVATVQNQVAAADNTVVTAAEGAVAAVTNAVTAAGQQLGLIQTQPTA